MIDQQYVNKTVVDGLEQALGRPVVKQNTAGKRPGYPFLAFTVTTPALHPGGTYGDYGGEYRREVRQVWSLTAHGDRDNETLTLALAACDWLEQGGRLWLGDRDIVVRKAGGIANRDTVLTAGFEYRYGFDVTFVLENVIEKASDELSEVIETARVTEEQEAKNYGK